MNKAKRQLAVLWKWRRIEMRRAGVRSPMARILRTMISTRAEALRHLNIVIPIS